MLLQLRSCPPALASLRAFVTFIFIGVGLSAGTASALTIDTTSFWDGTSAIGSFGEPNTATYGQVITADAIENVLNSFTFFLDDRLDPDPVQFEAYVYEWNGSRAVGSSLFQSGPYSTTDNGGAGGMEAFTIATGGVQLAAGSEYVLFFSASNLFNGSTGRSTWGLLDSPPGGGDYYAGGDFVFLNNASDFGLLTSSNWNIFNGRDLAFVAEFSDAVPIPEPSTSVLLSLGLGCLGARGRR